MSDIPPYWPDPLSPDFTPGGARDEETGPESAALPGDPSAALLDDALPPQPPPGTGEAPRRALRAGSRPVHGVGGAVRPMPNSPRRPAFPSGRRIAAPLMGNPATRSPWTGRAQGTTPLKGCGPKLGLFVALVIGVPLLLSIAGIFATRAVDGTEPQGAEGPVEHVEVSASARAVPEVPQGASKVRFEVQGEGGATADVTVRRDADAVDVHEVDLPYAGQVPLDAGTAEVEVLATGDGPLQCRIYAGTVLLSLTTGTDSVQCLATSSSLPDR